MRAILMAVVAGAALTGCGAPPPATAPEPKSKTTVVPKKDGTKVTITKDV